MKKFTEGSWILIPVFGFLIFGMLYLSQLGDIKDLKKQLEYAKKDRKIVYVDKEVNSKCDVFLDKNKDRICEEYVEEEVGNFCSIHKDSCVEQYNEEDRDYEYDSARYER
jgi:hypothetical protein